MMRSDVANLPWLVRIAIAMLLRVAGGASGDHEGSLVICGDVPDFSRFGGVGLPVMRAGLPASALRIFSSNR
jgi:hypothetical protein